ncbi:glycogen phosphorylase [Dorcoceras hygrometricum]|uniref:Alpha-1,4 glucan phosphorylase n=1 Tax=Dorcoceras hygrometricum TaxID=472368 RepID=A0A2Z7C9M6_9LAMI|nr:glycogen phosphorylase [Dorcoceras hygrometricum]
MAPTVETDGKATIDAGLLSKVPAIPHPLAEDPSEIASNIKYHAQYSPHFSPFKFDPEQVYYATAESVRDQLIQRWNDTYLHYHQTNPKQTYYLSMEYLQGRALTNAVGNLDIQDAYADALKQLGHELEVIVEQKFSPWEVVRHDVVYPIRFFGQVEVLSSGSRKWVGGEVIKAVAYDVPIPGYKTRNTNSLRLWEAKASAEDFNLFQFNDGQYESSAQLHSRAQQICAVLYPGDATEEGKLLRLKQQFFLCSASLQDIISRFKERRNEKTEIQWSEFPHKVAVQLNDTHPTLAIPELMRLLMDDEGLGWDESWDITTRTIAYTNHTVLPEALEKWSQTVMWKLLPRHMEIITEIDKRFIALIKSTKPDLEGNLPALRILDDNPQKAVVRMANLCVVSSHTFADNVDFHAEWESAKFASKVRLAQYVLQVTGVSIDPNTLFDIQVKRIHEYKRQLLNILGAVYRYKKLKEMNPEDRKNTTPRTIMIGGKAFATYTNAKRIVKLVNDVGAVINTDPEVNSFLKVVFVPNYNVSVAEILIPGSELSQHISTAGMEASGTSNMKFALNGCLIIGTLDGANVEIREEIGKTNFFLFGATADEVSGLRKDREKGLFKPDPRFEEAKQFIRSGAFGSYDYNPLLESLEGNTGYGRGDYFLVGHDFPSYMDAQEKVDEAYKDRKRWIKMSILSTAGSGKFSSDRTISQYASEIWNIKECPCPASVA